MNFLIALTETDKRILISLVILLILVFVIVGYIGLIVERVMKAQAKRAGKMMHNVVEAKVITTEKSFIKFGRKKNNQLFFQQTFIAFILLLIALMIYLIHAAVAHNFQLNLFDYKKEGFTTLFFLWDFPNAPHTTFFGMDIICGWPPILNTPHFEGTAWASYLIFPLLLVGGGWILVTTQAHMARAFKIKSLAKKIFNPTLEDKPTLPTPTSN